MGDELVPPAPAGGAGARGEVCLLDGGKRARELGPLHASEARTYLACPRKWWLEYMVGRVPAKSPTPLVRGTLIHGWLASWWGGSNTSEIPLPDDPVAKACCLAYGAYWGSPPEGAWDCETPFEATVGGVPVAGTLDARAIGPRASLTIVEHKSTSQDIAPGSPYWRQVVTTDFQVGMYRAAYPGSSILYDVIRKPALRQKSGEAEEDFVIRMIGTMAEEPTRFFQRAKVVRLEAEDEAFAQDVVSIDRLRRLGPYPRSPNSCFAYGRRCEFFDVCWEGADVMGPDYVDNPRAGR